MKKGNENVKVLRKHENAITRVRVEMTRKMTVAGKIIYAVVVTNMKSHRHYVIKVFDGIQDAFNFYKKATA